MQVSGRVPGANSSAKLFEDEREGTVFSTDGLEQKREELQHEFHQGVFITQLWFISQADAVRNRRSKGEKRKKKKEKINRVGKERGWDMEKLREGHNERLGYMVHHFASWGNSSALR